MGVLYRYLDLREYLCVQFVSAHRDLLNSWTWKLPVFVSLMKSTYTKALEIHIYEGATYTSHDMLEIRCLLDSLF